LVICAAVGGGVVGALLVSPATPARAADPPGFSRRVSANIFALVDAKGQTRGEWVADPKTGMVVLRMSGTDGKSRLAMSCLPNGTPIMALMNANSKMALELSADPKRGTQVRLYAPDGTTTRLLMQVMEGLKGPGGKPMQTSAIMVFGPTGGSSGLYTSPKGCFIGITDAQGKPVWNAP